MKERYGWFRGLERRLVSGKSFINLFFPVCDEAQGVPLAIALLVSAPGCPAWGQAPGLVWSTNVGGTLIGVDAPIEFVLGGE